jgi:hypothetical protein
MAASLAGLASLEACVAESVAESVAASASDFGSASAAASMSELPLVVGPAPHPPPNDPIARERMQTARRKEDRNPALKGCGTFRTRDLYLCHTQKDGVAIVLQLWCRGGACLKTFGTRKRLLRGRAGEIRIVAACGTRARPCRNVPAPIWMPRSWRRGAHGEAQCTTPPSTEQRGYPAQRLHALHRPVPDPASHGSSWQYETGAEHPPAGWQLVVTTQS